MLIDSVKLGHTESCFERDDVSTRLHSSPAKGQRCFKMFKNTAGAVIHGGGGDPWSMSRTTHKSAAAEVPRQVGDYEQQNRSARTGLIRPEEMTNNIATTQPRLLDFFLYNPGLKDGT